MGHHHHHGLPDHGRAFAVGVTLNLGFVALEAGCGIYAQSLALLADAGHNLSDVLGLALAWGAMALARRQPSQRRTYGMRRSTIIAALANAVLLLVVVGAISWEALRRFAEPDPPREAFIIWVAAAGFAVNSTTALLFVRGHQDVNIRGAFLHMAADAVVSLGVVAGGIVMWLTHWPWLDPLIGLAIALVILISTWGLLKESLDLALDAVPRGIEPRQVEDYLAALPGVNEVHDLHIWGLSTTEAALTAHLVMPASPGDDEFLLRVAHDLHDRFGIEHATLQVERGSLAEYPCGTRCAPAPRSGKD